METSIKVLSKFVFIHRLIFAKLQPKFHVLLFFIPGPVLFSRTLRLDLDPFDRHADEQLWQILEVSHLQRFVSETERGSEFIITEGGDNLRLFEQISCIFFSHSTFKELCLRCAET